MCEEYRRYDDNLVIPIKDILKMSCIVSISDYDHHPNHPQTDYQRAL